MDIERLEKETYGNIQRER